mgnify:FL=1
MISIAIHYYDTDITIGGEPVTIRSVVREQPDGRRYYHHSELVRERVSGVGPALGDPAASRESLLEASRARPAGQRPGSTNVSTPAPYGEHIVLRGRDVSRRRAPIEHIEVDEGR